MQYRLLLLNIIIALLMGLTSCGNKSEEPDIIIPTAKRTVLIYMAADNSLGTLGMDSDDLDEMLIAAQESGLNGCRVLVYHDARRVAPVLKELTPTGFVTIKSYPYDDTEYSVDISRMTKVFDDMREIAPAYDYGLVLWSHGNGWADTSTARTFGDDRGYNMRVTSLAQALEGQGFSFVYFDCCHMATVEVAYQLRHATPLIVASSSELPVPGMRYDLNLPVFVDDLPDMTEAAANTFNYYNSLTGSDRTCTMSVISTAGLDALADATRAIMETGPDGPKRTQCQTFMTSMSTLFDMGDYIDRLDCDQSLKDNWYEKLSAVVLYKAATPYLWERIAIKKHCGLCTYILEDRFDAEYRNYYNLAWWTDVISHNPLFQ